ncbi:helix-turn-helix domain-containing protein [Arthrobacter sp.]|uniref:AraC family transcriptional regulator n=1 Tax=Arthrobacter sp. TaxID=1667 RepID=UPI00339AAB37
MNDATPSPTRSGSILRTTDIDKAAEFVRQVYVPHKLNALSDGPLRFELSSFASARMTCGRLGFGAPVELVVPPISTAYHVNLPIRGSCTVWESSKEVVSRPGGAGVILDPDRPHTVVWDDAAVLYAIKVTRSALEAHAGALLGRSGDEPVKFQLDFDVVNPGGRGLLSAVRYLRKEMGREGGIGSSPILRGQLESYVMTQLLMVIPNNLTSTLVEPARLPKRRHISRVVDYVAANPCSPLTLPELSEVAGVSARALQEGFQEEFGVSPLTYVRNIRLEHAHAELLESEEGDSVTEVATRWGFTHLSRFSEYYRRRFGVLPSTTLTKANSGTATADEKQLRRLTHLE